MSSSLLNLSAAPQDPVERVMWLTGVKARVETELDSALASAYYQARLEHRFEEAIAGGPCSRKRALALTRRENERRGRTVRWSDGADPSSTAYKG